MLRLWTWLLTMSLALLLTPLPATAAEALPVRGSVEAGVANQEIRDDESRVNEYSTQGVGDRTSGYGKLDLEFHGSDTRVGVQAETVGSDDQHYDLSLDARRMLRGRFSYERFEHQLDHDRLNYLNAAVPDSSLFGVDNPGLILDPDHVPGAITTYDPATGAVTPAAPGAGTQQIGRAGLLGEDFASGLDFGITHKEYRNSADLTMPQLPNVTFHAGYRVENREGMEQSIGMSKCTSCHITGSGRKVDEQTRDLTLGATGRFGLLTVDYRYLDRSFREHAPEAQRIYDPALSPSASTTYNPVNGVFDNRLLYDYEDGALPYDTVPDSDKQSHVLKARVDLPRETVLLGSFVTAETESKKSGEAGIWDISTGVLKSGYDSYGMKAATRPTRNLKITLHARQEKLKNDDPQLTFYPMSTATTGGSFNLPNLGAPTPIPASFDVLRESVIDRDVTTLGIDTVYRLARYTTARLGYEYQEDDRDLHEFGATRTHEIKARLKLRPARNLNTWVGYTYTSIDNPLHNPDAAEYVNPGTQDSSFAGLPYFDKDGVYDSVWTPGYTIGSGPLYGTAYYDQRGTDLSNLPEDIHEAKASATWSPAANFSATVSYRLKLEENRLNKSTWEQTTHSPSLSMWYSPDQKLNLTFAYNYLGQSAESKFCQGWYDG